MDSVAKLMKKQLRFDPDDVRARYSLATGLFETGQTQNALSEFWKVLDVDREYESGEALFASALCLATLGQHSDALIYLHEALAIQGVDFDKCAIARSRSQAALHKFDEAEETLRNSIERKTSRRSGENVAKLWSELGKVLYQVGTLDGSDAAFFKASTYAPKNAEINARRALFYLDQHSLTEAKIPLEKAVALNSREAYTAIARAEYFRQVGNLETAFFLLENLPNSAYRILRRRPELFALSQSEQSEFDLM